MHQNSLIHYRKNYCAVLHTPQCIFFIIPVKLTFKCLWYLFENSYSNVTAISNIWAVPYLKLLVAGYTLQSLGLILHQSKWDLRWTSGTMTCFSKNFSFLINIISLMSYMHTSYTLSYPQHY